MNQRGSSEIRIFHVADAHLGIGYPGPDDEAKLRDVEARLEEIYQKAKVDPPDILVFTGDAFKEAKVSIDKAYKEITIFTKWLRKILFLGPKVIVISGTPSHDSIHSYKLARQILSEWDIEIVTEPKPVWLEIKGRRLGFACIPGVNRSNVVSKDEMKGKTTSEIHQLMSEMLEDSALGLSMVLDETVKCDQKFLLSHLTYIGAETGFTDLVMEHEPVLTKNSITPYDGVFLGHIHIPQEIDQKVFYPGPVERLSFGEETVYPGFWVHSYDGKWERHEHVRLNARPHITLDFAEESAEDLMDPLSFLGGLNLEGCVVKLHYTCTEEQYQRINRAELIEGLKQQGAYYIAGVSATILHSQRELGEIVNEELSPVEAVGRWADNSGLQDKKEALCSRTSDLLDKMGGGRA